MKTSKNWSPALAKKIIESLSEKKLVDLKIPKNEVIKLTDTLISNEMSIEETLNKEVREMLKKYDVEIERGRMDYHKLFELTKQKLVKERNIIL